MKKNLKDLTIMKIQRLMTNRLKWKFYNLKYLALKNFFKSCLKILQGTGFLKRLGRVVQSKTRRDNILFGVLHIPAEAIYYTTHSKLLQIAIVTYTQTLFLIYKASPFLLVYKPLSNLMYRNECNLILWSLEAYV